MFRAGIAPINIEIQMYGTVEPAKKATCFVWPLFKERFVLIHTKSNLDDRPSQATFSIQKGRPVKTSLHCTFKLHVEDRGCIACVNEIESKYHVFHCPFYEDIRDTFIN